ncbi:MAG: hypothetical protein ACRDWX_07915 [Acidimicrobiia bacterium]
MRLLLVSVVMVLSLAGCSLDALLAGGMAGSEAAGRAEQGLQAVEQAAVVAGEGAGRIPAPRGHCPEDYELGMAVTASTPGWSKLVGDERAAFQVLLRSAAACGQITADPRYLAWKDR